MHKGIWSLNTQDSHIKLIQLLTPDVSAWVAKNCLYQMVISDVEDVQEVWIEQYRVANNNI